MDPPDETPADTACPNAKTSQRRSTMRPDNDHPNSRGGSRLRVDFRVGFMPMSLAPARSRRRALRTWTGPPASCSSAGKGTGTSGCRCRSTSVRRWSRIYAGGRAASVGRCSCACAHRGARSAPASSRRSCGPHAPARACRESAPTTSVPAGGHCPRLADTTPSRTQRAGRPASPQAIQRLKAARVPAPGPELALPSPTRIRPIATARHHGRCSCPTSAAVRTRAGTGTLSNAPAAATSARRNTRLAVTGRPPGETHLASARA